MIDEQEISVIKNQMEAETAEKMPENHNDFEENISNIDNEDNIGNQMESKKGAVVNLKQNNDQDYLREPRLLQNRIIPSRVAEENEMGKILYTDLELLEGEVQQQSFLLDQIIPSIGTGVIVGKPDLGKSHLIRQLCLYISAGVPDFIGFPLKPRYGRTLYVSTEDGIDAVRESLDKQLKGMGAEGTGRMLILFAESLDPDQISQRIDFILKENPCDFVVVDGLGDVFKGADSNSNMGMRNTVKPFSGLASVHRCFIMLVTHINKAAYNSAPEQQHIQGGSALVQKVRLAIQLSEGDAGKRLLTITKGNYIPQELKRYGFELNFSEETMLFTATGVRKVAEKVIKPMQPEENDPEDEIIGYWEILEAIFSGNALTDKQLRDRFMEVTRVSVRTYYRLKDKFINHGFVLKCEGGFCLGNASGQE